jgi:hypothetical protein
MIHAVVQFLLELAIGILHLLVRFVCAFIAIFILVPLVVLVCTPYLLLAATADRHEYWSSFWWRTKRLASATADFAGIVGASAP